MRRQGEVWSITHVRQGDLVVRLLEDVPEGKEWFACELVEGEPEFISRSKMGSVENGDTLQYRQSLVEFHSRVDKSEQR